MKEKERDEHESWNSAIKKKQKVHVDSVDFTAIDENM